MHLSFICQDVRIAVMVAGRKDIKLLTVKVAGKELQPSEYDLTEKLLTLSKLPKGEFEVEIKVDIKPQASSSQNCQHT